MKNVIALFKALFKNWFRSKTGVFFSLLFPVMLLLIFSTVFGGQQGTEFKLYIQNNDVVDGEPTNVSESFIKALESTESFDIEMLDRDVNVSEYGEEESSFSSYRALVIPEGFQENAVNKSMEVRAGVIYDTLVQIENRSGENINESQQQNISAGKRGIQQWMNSTEEAESAEILLLTSEGDQSAPMVKGVVHSVVSSFNSKMIGVDDTTVDLNMESVEKRELSAVDYYLPGYIAAFIMTNGIIGVTSNVSEFKRNGTLKRLTATPLKKREWILGNVAQQTVLAFILTGVMVLLGIIIFGVNVYPDPYALGMIFIGAVAFCSVGMVLGGLIKDVEAASGAGNAIAFPMMFLSGAFWPVEMMPDYLQVVARVLPLYYFHQGLRNIMILQNPSEALIPASIVGIFGLLFLVIAIFMTKWKEL